MKKLIFLVSLAYSYSSYAQLDTSFKLDLLKAPASPASNLLGFATSDIDKPTDVADFMVSLQNATSSFTKLPTNYAIDIAPFLLFAKDTANTRNIKTNKHNIIKQSLVLSFAYKNPDSAETALNQNSAYTGFGFKVSLIKRELTPKTEEGFKKIKDLQDRKLALLKLQQDKMDADPELIALENERDSLINDANKTGADKKALINHYAHLAHDKYAQLKELKRNEMQAELDSGIKQIASTFQVERYGLSLDVAGGISGEFLNKRFDSSRVHNAGVWFNLGYTGKTGVSFIGLGRYLYNPDQVVPKDSVTATANTSNYDLGGRLIYSKSQSKFSASLEYISRWCSADAVKRTWRLVFNADYALWQNQKLTFSFGRNFDGTITKDGNLVAALSFLTGFGNKRK